MLPHPLVVPIVFPGTPRGQTAEMFAMAREREQATDDNLQAVATRALLRERQLRQQLEVGRQGRVRAPFFLCTPPLPWVSAAAAVQLGFLGLCARAGFGEV